MRVARKQKLGYEVLCEAVFRPLAQLLVAPLARLGVPPPAVVVANAACAVAAAAELTRGELVLAAVLLQAKTVLDNADGQLARTTGRVTAFGRYLDSESDLLTNAGIFAALGWYTGRPWLALGGFIALTAMLSVNFNLDRLARRAPATPPGGGLLAGVYRALYTPQDRLVERFARGYGGTTLTVVANFGLSTQLAVLGGCLAVGRPELYVWILLGGVALLLPLLARPGTAAVPEAL